MSNFKNKLLEVLKQDERVWIEDELNVVKLKDFADKCDEKFIEILLNNEETRKHFFMQIKDVYVFKQNDFKFFLDENKLDNSYTSFANQIGLYNNSKLLRNTGEVVLNWPFKDCVLEGGQSSEDGTDTFFEIDEKSGDFEEKTSKRKEIFFNEVLARDEIDRLEEKKALKNFKRFTKSGEEKVGNFKRDAEINQKRGLPEDTITDNLIIKGNNLLALHSLKKEFHGKVKLIYIDPPYNTGSDSFSYNDNFNHSTWLTFMKNRLEVAKELLRDDGVIFVHCDNNEHAYLKVLMDEVFNNNFLSFISIKVKAPSGDSSKSNKLLEDVSEYILSYSKKAGIKNLAGENIKEIVDKNSKTAEQYTYILESLGEIGEKDFTFTTGKGNSLQTVNVYKVNNFKIRRIKKEEKNEKFYVENYDNVCRTAKFSGEFLNQFKNKKNDVLFFEYTSTRGDKKGIIQNNYVINGEGLIYLKNYSKIIENDSGIQQVAKIEKATNFIDNISWQGIANEGGVILKKGKKPEELIRRIIKWTTEKEDIILDYHLGSGTTAAVAHKMGRQYIGIEQMDYGENDSVVRLKNVINGDNSGISKIVDWNGGGEFVYFELAKWNEEAKEKIQSLGSLKEIEKFFEEMYENYFLNYNLKIKEFREKLLRDEKFKNLSLDKQKYIFLKMLDLNQMYVNFDERNDEKYGLSDDDIKLSEDFYNIND